MDPVIDSNVSSEGEKPLKTHVQQSTQPQPEASHSTNRLSRRMIGNHAVTGSPRAHAEGLTGEPGTDATTSFAHDFSRIPLYSNSPVGLQANLAVNTPGQIYQRGTGSMVEHRHEHPLGIQMKSLVISAPNDADEKEADEVARKVVNGQSAEIRRTNRAVCRKSVGSAETTPDFQSNVESSRGNGQALDELTRSEMGSKMGADFSKVKVHTGSEAHALCESINARAFTHGTDIYFKQGEFNPTSKQGKELLAHELVHTQQQAGLGMKVQRQQEKGSLIPDTRKRLSIPGTNIGKKIEAILSPGISKGIKGSNVTVEAKLDWELVFGTMSAIEVDKYKAQFLYSEAKVSIEEHFYSHVLGAYKQDLFLNGEPEKKQEPGMTFTKSGSLELFKVELDEGGLEFKLAELELTGGYTINQANFHAQSATVQAWLAPYAKIIEAGKMSLTAALKIAVSVDVKPSGYLEKTREKTSAEEAGQKHTAQEQKYKEEANKAKANKNEARAKTNKLDNEIKQKRNELKRIRSEKNLPPEQASKNIEALEKEIADQQSEADKFREAWEKEKKAMDDALESARGEQKAAKGKGRELKQLDKEIRQLEERSGRFKKAIYKLEQRLERQRRKVEKIITRLAEKAAKWVEEKAARRLGTRLALKAAQMVAKVILRAIPIIGELLLLWDALNLLWDIGRAIWDWLWGKEADGDGGTEEEAKQAGTGEDAEATDAMESGDTGALKAGPGTKTLDGVPDGLEKGRQLDPGRKQLRDGRGVTPQLASLPSARDRRQPPLEKGIPDSGTIPTDAKDTTTTPYKDNSPVPSADTTTTVKPKTTSVKETGAVAPWTEPSPNATELNLISFGAAGLNNDELISGEVYLFKLVIRYTNDAGGVSIIESNVNEAFRYVGSKNGIPKFEVETSFIIKTNTRAIFFEKNYPVKVRK